MADCAADGRTEHTVVMGEMPGYAADHRAFDAALSLGGAGSANERKYQGRRDTHCLHATLLASIADPIRRTALLFQQAQKECQQDRL